MTGRGAGSVSDSSEEAQQKLAALEAKYADDLTRSEAQFVEVAESVNGGRKLTPLRRGGFYSTSQQLMVW